MTDEARKGLLGQGSILTVTSHADRTSPVVRGKWILENLLGTPPPPPPPNVPALQENEREGADDARADGAAPRESGLRELSQGDGSARLRARELRRGRHVAHRRRGGTPIDASGQLADGATVDGVVAMRQAILSRPELFVSTMTEKLLTTRLGRGIDHRDMPAVREIVRRAARNDYRFSSLVLGVVDSVPFLMRKAQTRLRHRMAVECRFKCQSKPKSIPVERQCSFRRLAGPSDVPARRRRHRGAAVSRRDGAGDDGHREDGGECPAPVGRRVLPERRHHGAVEPDQGRRRLRFLAEPQPLERFRDSLVVVSNLTRAGTTAGDHAVSAAGWLTGVYAKRTEAEDVRAGTTIDQIVAKQIGQDTPFPSLELATEDFTGYVGACTVGFSCVYANTICWSSPTTPLPMEINPRVVFERLFGEPGTPSSAAAQRAA